jgi:hypothetical protein
MNKVESVANYGLIIVFLFFLTGCATHLYPPTDVERTSTAYLVDYGYLHSSLILPESKGNYVEYTFGDWSFMVLGYRNPINATRVIMFPTTGALGRRTIPQPSNLTKLKQRLDAEKLYELPASKSRIESLRSELERTFEENIKTLKEDPVRGFHYVKTDEIFWVGNTCNLKVAEWIESIGYQVKIRTLLSVFERHNPKP